MDHHVEIALEASEQILDAVADPPAHDGRIGTRTALLQEQLALHVLEQERARQQRDRRRLAGAVGEIARLADQVVLGLWHVAVIEVVEIIGDGDVLLPRLEPALTADQDEGGVALGVQIGHQDALLSPDSEALGQHDGNGRLTDATFPVGDGDMVGHGRNPPQMSRSLWHDSRGGWREWGGPKPGCSIAVRKL